LISFHKFICLLSDSRGNDDGFEPGTVDSFSGLKNSPTLSRNQNP
jgi:hypothetical protein